MIWPFVSRAARRASPVILACFTLVGCAVASPDAPETTSEAILNQRITVQAIEPISPVAITKDPSVCASHYLDGDIWSGFACAAALAEANMQMLVWCNPSSPCIEALSPATVAKTWVWPPDGYRIYVSYTLFGSVHTAWSLAATQTNPQVTAYGLVEKYPGLSPCYTVRAYKGSVESVDSQIVCMDPKPAVTTLSAPIIQENSFVHHEDSDTGYFTSVGTYAPPAAGQMVAGWQCSFVSHAIGHDDWAWAGVRGAVRFDLRGIGRVWKATLHLHRALSLEGLIDGACHDSPEWCASPSSSTCADQLLAADVDWTGGLAANTTPSGGVVIPVPGDETVDLDVTSTVRNWVNQLTPNDGFVLRNSTNEGYGQQRSECLTYFDGARLDVQYF